MKKKENMSGADGSGMNTAQGAFLKGLASGAALTLVTIFLLKQFKIINK